MADRQKLLRRFPNTTNSGSSPEDSSNQTLLSLPRRKTRSVSSSRTNGSKNLSQVVDISYTKIISITVYTLIIVGIICFQYNVVPANASTTTNLPDLQEGTSRFTWTDGKYCLVFSYQLLFKLFHFIPIIFDADDSDEDFFSTSTGKHSSLEQTTPRSSTAKKMLPHISNAVRVRRNIFGDTQSLCNRIKMTYNSRRSSYTGISDEGGKEYVTDSPKPSIQGTGILSKSRGERSQLIDASDFPCTKETPIYRSLEFKKPNLTPWTKAKPFIGRPQSGQPRLSKRLTTGSATGDMACVGSKIKPDLTESVHFSSENRAKKTVRKFRTTRAKSASLVQESS